MKADGDSEVVKRWRCLGAPKPSKPGVFRRKEGGYLRAGSRQPIQDGKIREIKITVEDGDASSAYASLQEELQRVRDGAEPSRSTTARSATSPSRCWNGRLKPATSSRRRSREVGVHAETSPIAVVRGLLHRRDPVARRRAVEEASGAERRSDARHLADTRTAGLAILSVIMNTATGELELVRNR